MTRPLIAFVAILRDEATNIRATLESVRPYIDWFSVVIDDRTQDKTAAIVDEVMRSPSEPQPYGVAGLIHHRPFQDFSSQRNLALDLVNDLPEETRPVFTLTMSGDEVLDGGKALRDALEAKRDATDGAYAVTMFSQNASWPFTRVLRTGGGWKYVGEIHERPVGPNGETRAGEIIPGVRIVHSDSDLSKKVKRLREYDLPTLTRIVADETRPIEDRAHSIYHLASTHAALGAEAKMDAEKAGHDPMDGPALQHDFQAMALYLRYAQLAKRSERPEFDLSKAMYAYFLALHIADKCHLYEPAELEVRLEDLVAAAPRLPEARFLLAQIAAYTDTRRGLHLALEAVKVAREVRQDPSYEATDVRIEWLALALAARCAKAQKKEAQAKKLSDEALAAGAPKEMVEHG